MKIGIGVPSGDTMMVDTAYSILGLFGHSSASHQLSLYTARASVPSQSQNRILWDACVEGADAVMLIDSDMAFPPDALERLLEHDKHFVGAPYRVRQPPYDLAMRPITGDRRVPEGQTGLVEADFIASGLTYISRDVLDAVGYPWMEEKYGAHPDELVGHDVNFCRKARQEGFQVWADFDLARRIGHIGAVQLRIP